MSLTSSQVAQQLGMTVNAVLANIWRGTLRAQKKGMQYWITERALAAFIADRKARTGKVKIHAGSPGRPPRKKAA